MRTSGLPASSDGGRNLVFLIGSGRSGSTLLYKALGLHPDLAYISSYDAATALPAGGLQRICRHWQQRKRRVWFAVDGQAHGRDKWLLNRLLPTPVEGERLYARCGVPLFEDESAAVSAEAVRRLARTFERIRRHAGARRLVTKRIANNRRLPWLIEPFPQARFIHLLRDGREVADSFDRVGWWTPQVRVWWDGRPMQALLDDGMSRIEVCARTWVEVLKGIERDLALLPPAQSLEVRFEQLIADPAGALRRIFEFLEVKDEPFAAQTLQEIAFRRPTAHWNASWSPQEYDAVLQIERPWLERYGYACAE